MQRTGTAAFMSIHARFLIMLARPKRRTAARHVGLLLRSRPPATNVPQSALHRQLHRQQPPTSMDSPRTMYYARWICTANAIAVTPKHAGTSRHQTICAPAHVCRCSLRGAWCWRRPRTTPDGKACEDCACCNGDSTFAQAEGIRVAASRLNPWTPAHSCCGRHSRP